MIREIQTLNKTTPNLQSSMTVEDTAGVKGGLAAFTDKELVPVIPTIQILRTFTGRPTTVTVACYAAVGDGGGGTFRLVTTGGPYVDNGGTIIVPTGGDGSSAWIRKYSGGVCVSWFGAVGEGAVESSQIAAALLAGAGTSVNFVRGKSYNIGGATLIPPSNTIIELNGATFLNGIFNVAASSGVTIKSGTIDYSSASGPSTAVDGVVGSGSADLTLDSLIFNKTTMLCQLPTGLSVIECKFFGEGVFTTAAISSGGTNTTYKGNYFTGWSSQLACNAVGGDNIGTLITENIFYDTDDTSIFCRAFTGRQQRNAIISNNILINTGKGGITAYVPQNNTGALVENITISNNVIMGVGSLVLTSSISVFDGELGTGNILRNISVTDNVIDGRRRDGTPVLANVRGIRFDAVSGGTCTGNTVQYTQGTGIQAHRGTGCVISNNSVKYAMQNFTLVDNETFGGISVYDQDKSTIENNTVTNCGSNQHGMHLERVRNCTISGILSDNAGYGLQVSADGSPSDETDYNVYHNLQLTGNVLGPIDPGVGDQNSQQINLFDDSGSRQRGNDARRATVTPGIGVGKMGYTFFNTTSGRPNFWTGTAWVYADGTAA